jgi:hypothetical protein
MKSRQQEIVPGIWKISFGDPEVFTPVRMRARPVAEQAITKMDEVTKSPVELQHIAARCTPRGFQVEIDIDADEQFYGLGLQLLSFNQRGKKKTLRVNSDPIADLGDSHAPVPFFVSTKGYGVGGAYRIDRLDEKFQRYKVVHGRTISISKSEKSFEGDRRSADCKRRGYLYFRRSVDAAGGAAV